jgi:hypothetical protein
VDSELKLPTEEILSLFIKSDYNDIYRIKELTKGLVISDSLLNDYFNLTYIQSTKEKYLKGKLTELNLLYQDESRLNKFFNKNFHLLKFNEKVQIGQEFIRLENYINAVESELLWTNVKENDIELAYERIFEAKNFRYLRKHR